jgi:hypothetical protein
MPVAQFGHLPIGGKFKKEGFGSGINKKVLSGMVYEKITKSKAKIVDVYGNYGTRHIGGVECFGYYASVKID